MHIIDEAVFRTMKFHVFNADSDPVGVFMHAEDAAASVAVLGEGACIADPNCAILWSEGAEAFPASESYDEVASLVRSRMAAAEAKRTQFAAILRLGRVPTI